MTGRERVNRMFARQDHDRVPRYDSYWTDTLERWGREAQAVLDLLDADLHSLGWHLPTPFRGQQRVLEEDAQTQVVLTEWGETQRYFKGRMGTPDHLGFPCPTREEWETKLKPALIAHGAECDLPAIQREYAAGRKADRWNFLIGMETFEAMRRLMGDEVMMMAMAAEPEWVADVSRTYTDRQLALVQGCYDAGVHADGLWIYGDMAFNHSTICSPAMYRELIWPDHKRLADWAHAHDMKFIFHTDGDVNGVIPDYIAAGFDALQPLEAKARMDIRQLCPRYGDRLAFFGNIDAMVLSTNDPGKIEAEIASKLAAGKAKRSYMYHSDHSIPPAVTWETYRFVIKLLDTYGRCDS
jgi:uroporphyrinogen decarboxylase